MRVTIQASGFVLTESLRSYTERRLAIALGWAGEHLRKLAVSLSDVNGPRGGIDKRCKIHVQLGSGKEVVIENTEVDMYVAIDRAAERADRAVVRKVERKRDFSHTRLTAEPSMATRDEDSETDKDIDSDIDSDRISTDILSR